MDLDLIKINLDVNDNEEVINELGTMLLKKGYVKDTYINAVIERERILPTGLDLGELGVAIPHTDSQHVNQANIAVGLLKNPIEFSRMVDPTKKIKVQLVFLLAIKNPEKQVELLGKLMAIFQDIELLKSIQKSTSKEEIAGKLNHLIFK